MSCSTNIQDNMWGFEILNGNTIAMSIVDPLLDTEARAEERAMSEFLKNSYSLIRVNVATHLTSFSLNDTLNIAGVPYLVKSISTSMDKLKIVTTLGVVRYD